MTIASDEPSEIRQRTIGCMLGLAYGDAIGASYEGRLIEQAVWFVIGKTAKGEKRYTDDTQMSIDLAESMIACHGFVADDVAKRFAANYRWSRGYGPGAAKILKLIKKGTPWQVARTSAFPNGSWGNGGAMRAPVVALFHSQDSTGERVVELARAQASITHAHTLAQDGAALVAASLFHALRLNAGQCNKSEFWRNVVSLANLQDAKAWEARCEWVSNGLNLSEDSQPSPRVVAGKLGNGIAALDSCVTAIYIAIRFMEDDFFEMLNFIRQCKGDVDTMGAIAGSIYGAINGFRGFYSSRNINIENIKEIEELGERIFAMSQH